MNRISQISDGVFQILGSKPSAHHYLLRGHKNILIDVGTRENFPKLLQDLSSMGLGIADIHQVILTHCHYDHSGAIEYFTHSEILCSPLCFQTLESGDESSIYALKYGCQLPKLPQNTTILREGDLITNNSQSWKVIFTPGHSIDGICLLEEKTKILIAGDTVFAKGIPALITHSGSDASLLYSLEKLQKEEILMILSGHGINEIDPRSCLKITKENILKRIEERQNYFQQGVSL
ncbi:MAG: MBL fold metallo-hydrolase [Brevinema sp.]